MGSCVSVTWRSAGSLSSTVSTTPEAAAAAAATNRAEATKEEENWREDKLGLSKNLSLSWKNWAFVEFDGNERIEGFNWMEIGVAIFLLFRL